MEIDRKTFRENIECYDLESLLRRPSLRANIPRRASQTPRCEIEAEEIECGVGCIRGQWLQSFAKRSSYIFIYGILGSIYGSYYAYFCGVVTTLEKRFEISTQIIGVAASAGKIAQMILCLVLPLCVPKAHKPKLLGVGVLMMITSTILFTLPHFLYESKYFTYRRNDTDVEHCTGETQTCTENLERNGPIIFLILTQGLHGIGGSFYSVVGKSYEEENIDRNRQAALMSILLVLKILGPAFGYWLSSMFLKISEYPKLMPFVTEKEPHWIGAWWLGSPVIGFILIVPGILLTMFPTTLPKVAIRKLHNRLIGAKENRKNVVVTMSHLTKLQDLNLFIELIPASPIKMEQRWCCTGESDKTAALKKFFMNSTFNCIHYTVISSTMGFMAYFIFLPKYVETQFRIPASNANLISGSVILISSAVGIVTANSIITRYRPSARALASWTVIVGILSVGGLVSYIYLNCEANDYVIKTMVTLQSSTSCKCINFSIYDEYHQTFISSCHAKCENMFCINKTKGFESCNNVDELQMSNIKKVLKNFCSMDCHSDFLKFIIITCLMAFIFATGRTSNYWFEARYEEKQEISSFISSGITVFGFLISILAPIIFGYIFDKFCLLWEENCYGIGNCWLYDNEKLRLSINLTAIGFAVISIISDLRVWLSVKNLTLFDETDYYLDDNDQI